MSPLWIKTWSMAPSLDCSSLFTNHSSTNNMLQLKEKACDSKVHILKIIPLISWFSILIFCFYFYGNRLISYFYWFCHLIFGLLISGISSCLTSLNFWTTILNLRSYYLTLKTMPLFPWALLITGGMLLLTLPILSGALLMVLALVPHGIKISSTRCNSSWPLLPLASIQLVSNSHSYFLDSWIDFLRIIPWRATNHETLLKTGSRNDPLLNPYLWDSLFILLHSILTEMSLIKTGVIFS